jgi:hypothetical protein
MLDAAAAAYISFDIQLECWFPQNLILLMEWWMLQQTHISEWIYCWNVGCRSRRIFQNEYTVGMLDAASDAYFRIDILLECWMLQQTHISV